MTDAAPLPLQGPKIAVQLLGGLGNQLFQAAAGMALAHRLHGRLIFDLSRFRQKGLRAYALAPFGLDATVMPAETGVYPSLRRGIHRLMGQTHRPLWWSGMHLREAMFAYDPRFEALAGDVILSGYFQSPRYFAGIEAEIARAFAPLRLAPDIDPALVVQISGDDTVAIHLRRGDFASDLRAAAVHGVLAWEYYDRAVAHVLARVPRARLFVFSDHAEAATAGAARWDNAVAMAGKSAGEDFYLMSCARHHIIANSSFSWWSAWLDRREDGIRIAPEAWFAPGNPQDTRDLFPAGWVRL